RHNNVKTLKVNLKKLGFTVPGNGTNFYGSQTEKKVKEFQKYFGLSVTGKVDKKTNDKILKNINSSLQRGKSNADVKQLKVDLIIIGFPVPGKGTYMIGKQTEANIKQFQKNQKLIVNGIVDDVTSNRIAQLKKTNPVVLANSVRHKKVKTLKVNLEKLGFKVPGSGTELFGSATEKKVKEFQKYYKLPVNGMVDNKTNNKINSILNSPLQKGKRHKDTIKLKTDLKKVGYPVPGNGTNLYGVETEKIVKQFQKDHKLVVNGIADDVTLAKLATLIKNNSSNIKIFIDPGHGGSDPGAMAGNLKEKDLTLDIAKRTEKYLKEYKGVSIKMSRTTDKTLTLQQRTDAANNWKADFFFSVHINSGGGTGVESFIYDKKPTQDEINKQKIIHEHISKNISDRDRGEKRANFHVLRESKMTAMLFEYYFIDTKSDQKKLESASKSDILDKLSDESIAKSYILKK